MKILVISSLFPNNREPGKGVFVKQQLKELLKLCELKVIAPIPWSLPIKIVRKWDNFRKVNKEELIEGIEVYHPRYLVIPKIARSLYGLFYYLGIRKTGKRISKQSPLDAVIAYFAYPDGFAASLMAGALKKKLIVVALGSDINVFTRNRVRRFLTVRGLKKANRIIAVSAGLKSKIEELGIPKEKISVIANGVDISRFRPRDKFESRERLSLPKDKRIILFVGNLKKDKGLGDLTDALAKIKTGGEENILLILIGEGDFKKPIMRRIEKTGLASMVKLVGAKPHEEIGAWMSACDVFCLPSHHEGSPNVVMEALACARPVVATKVGGVPELIRSEDEGILVEPGNPESLAQGLLRALDKNWDPEILRARTAGKTWEENARRLFDELRLLIQ